MYLDTRFKWTVIEDGPVALYYHDFSASTAKGILGAAVDHVKEMGPGSGVKEISPIRMTLDNSVKEFDGGRYIDSNAFREKFGGQAYSGQDVLLLARDGGDLQDTALHACHPYARFPGHRASNQRLDPELPGARLNEGLATYYQRGQHDYWERAEQGEHPLAASSRCAISSPIRGCPTNPSSTPRAAASSSTLPRSTAKTPSRNACRLQSRRHDRRYLPPSARRHDPRRARPEEWRDFSGIGCAERPPSSRRPRSPTTTSYGSPTIPTTSSSWRRSPPPSSSSGLAPSASSAAESSSCEPFGAELNEEGKFTGRYQLATNVPLRVIEFATVGFKRELNWVFPECVRLENLAKRILNRCLTDLSRLWRMAGSR